MDIETVAFTNAYSGTANGTQYEHWREEICRGFLNIDIGPCRDGVVDMQAQFARLPLVSIALSAGSSAAIGRTPDTNRDGDNDLALVCGTQGTMAYLYRGEVLEVGRSVICLSETAQPSTAILDECRNFTALKISRSALLSLRPEAEDHLFKPMQIDETLNSMIGRYASLAAESALHLDKRARFLMGQHLIDLVDLALGAHCKKSELAERKGWPAAQLALMKEDIVANASRNRFNIGDLAKRYGLGARQVQRLFECDGATFTEFLLEQRLLLAHKMLRNPTSRRKKISDVAYSAGFADLSYFNRCFKRRFGNTPSEARETLIFE